MSWWDEIKARFSESGDHMRYLTIPRDQIDEPGSESALEPYDSYFRLWLDEMFLANSVVLAKEQFPAVHSEVRVAVAGRGEASFSSIARPPDDGLTKGVRLNYALTPLMPYNGGTIEVEAALVVLTGRDSLAPAIDVLKQVGDLVAPPLGQVLTLAGSLSAGLRSLLERGGSARLGLHRTLVSEGGGGTAIARPGSMAVFGPGPVLDVGRLRVIDHQLRVAPDGGDGGAAVGLGGVDYMLFRVEGRAKRDDWRLPDIDDPRRRALKALDQGNVAEAEGFRAVAVAAAYDSSDLAESDRRRVIDGIKAEYQTVEGRGRDATGDVVADLLRTVEQYGGSRERARALGPLSAEEAFA